MVMLIAGGSLSTGSHDPYCGTLMPLGPSTPSVGLGVSLFFCAGSARRGAIGRQPIMSRLASGPPILIVGRLGWHRESPRPASLDGAKGEHPLHVPGHGHKAPLAPSPVQPTQQKLPEA